jgi:hypothetical protein
MRAVLTEPFAANLIASPPEVQKAFGKQLTNLLRDLRHPSLRAKKYQEHTGLWQARINDDWRMFFTIEGDVYVLRRNLPSDSRIREQTTVAHQFLRSGGEERPALHSPTQLKWPQARVSVSRQARRRQKPGTILIGP